jgi:hypothetical protein
MTNPSRPATLAEFKAQQRGDRPAAPSRPATLAEFKAQQDAGNGDV